MPPPGTKTEGKDVLSAESQEKLQAADVDLAEIDAWLATIDLAALPPLPPPPVEPPPPPPGAIPQAQPAPAPAAVAADPVPVAPAAAPAAPAAPPADVEAAAAPAAPAAPEPAAAPDPAAIAAEFAGLEKALRDMDPRYQTALKNKNMAGGVRQLRDKAQAMVDAKADTKKAAFAVEELKRSVDAALANNDRFDEMKKIIGKSSTAYLPDGAAGSYEAEKLKPGKEFKAFLAALKKFEADRPKNDKKASGQAANLENLAEVERTARVYLKHFEDDLKPREQKAAESQRKKAICETTLKQAQHLRMAEKLRELGKPEDWDFEKQNRAGGLYAQVMFEQTAKPAKALGEGADDKKGICAAFWLDHVEEFSTDPTKPVGKVKKQFIAKPADAEGIASGFRKGDGAAREVMAKALNDQILAQSGLDFGVCPTHIATIDNKKLGAKPDPDAPSQRICAVQQLAANDGSLLDLEKDPAKEAAVVAKIPKENYDKVAMLDLISMNMDRHPGNLLLQGADSDTPNMVPIDHGLAFPSKTTLMAWRWQMTDDKNHLCRMPQSDQPLSPEVLAALAKIDPDKIAKEMKAAQKTVETLDAEGKAAAKAKVDDSPPDKKNAGRRNLAAVVRPKTKEEPSISDETINLTKRAIQFMQKAGAQLTVKELFNAIAMEAGSIFADEGGDIDDATVQKIVASVKQRSRDSKEFEEAYGANSADHGRILKALGWCGETSTNLEIDHFIRENPGRVLKIIRGQIKNPEAVREINELVTALGGPDKVRDKHKINLASLSVRDQLKELRDARQKAGKGAADAKEPKAERGVAAMEKRVKKLNQNGALKKIALLFPDEKLSDPDREKELKLQLKALETWDEVEKLGGPEKFFELGGILGLTPGDRPTLDAFKDFADLISRTEALKQIDAIKPEEMAARQRATVDSEMVEFRAVYSRIKNADTREKFRAGMEKAEAGYGAGKLDECHNALTAIKAKLFAEESAERAKEQSLDISAKDVEKKWRLLSAHRSRISKDRVTQLYTQHKTNLAQWLSQGKFTEITLAQKAFMAEAERVLLGDKSKIAQCEKRLAEAQRKLAANPDIAAMPNIVSSLNGAVQTHSKMIVEEMTQYLNTLEKSLNDAIKAKAAPKAQ